MNRKTILFPHVRAICSTVFVLCCHTRKYTTLASFLSVIPVDQQSQQSVMSYLKLVCTSVYQISIFAPNYNPSKTMKKKALFVLKIF